MPEEQKGCWITRIRINVLSMLLLAYSTLVVIFYILVSDMCEMNAKVINKEVFK